MYKGSDPALEALARVRGRATSWAYGATLEEAVNKAKDYIKSFLGQDNVKSNLDDGLRHIGHLLGAATPLEVDRCPALYSWLATDTSGSDTNIA